MAEGSPEMLTAPSSASRISLRLPAGEWLPELSEPARVDDGEAEIATTQPTRVLHELTGWALGRGLELEGLRVARASLEEVYLELTREAEREAAP